MPKITFASKGVSISVKGGMELLEVYRINPELPLKFGCTRGDCGVCAIKISAGLENISLCSAREAQTLQKKGLDGRYRLACQCAVNGDVTVD